MIYRLPWRRNLSVLCTRLVGFCLRGAEIHLTHIPAPSNEASLRRLGVNLTSDPSFATRNLFSA